MALKVRDRGKPPPRPPHRLAVMVWSDGDRQGIARCDDTSATVLVIIPTGMWCTTGTRVALVHYPDGWVVARKEPR